MRKPNEEDSSMFRAEFRQAIHRMFVFSVGPLLGALSPIVVLPVVARVAGVEGWASFGVAQAIGSFGSILVSSGWPTLGPARVARVSDVARQKDVYLESFWTKCFVFCVLLVPICFSGPFWGAINFGFTDILVCVSMMITGFTPAWFGVGIGSAGLAVGFGTVPRVVSTLLSVVPILITDDIVWYPILLILGTMISLFLFHLTLFRSLIPPTISFADTRRALRDTAPSGMIEACSGAASMAVLPVVSIGNLVTIVASVTSADKLYRYALFGIDVIGDTLQAWVVSGVGGRSRRKRVLAALGAHFVLGISVALFLAVFGAAVTGWLFGAAVRSTTLLTAIYGITFFSRSMSRGILRMLILPFGDTKKLIGPNLTASVISTVVMCFFGLSLTNSAVWVVLGYLSYEVLLLAFISIQALRLQRGSLA